MSPRREQGEISGNRNRSDETRFKRIVRILLITAVAVAFSASLAFSIFLIGNKTNGYYTLFSKIGYIAADDLMAGSENFDAFLKGEMVLFSKEDDLERSLSKGQIVLFRKGTGDSAAVSARRIDSVFKKELSSGVTVTTYRLKADNSEELLPFDVAPNEILGVFSGVSAPLGQFFTFMNSFAGFVILILLPALFGASSAIFLLFSYLRKRS